VEDGPNAYTGNGQEPDEETGCPRILQPGDRVEAPFEHTRRASSADTRRHGLFLDTLMIWAKRASGPSEQASKRLNTRKSGALFLGRLEGR